MKYLVVRWSTLDGEYEYGDYVLVKTEKKTWSDKKVFKKMVDDNYGKGAKALEYGKYELPNDYRIVKLEGIWEITEEERNALHSTRVVSWETDY